MIPWYGDDRRLRSSSYSGLLTACFIIAALHEADQVRALLCQVFLGEADCIFSPYFSHNKQQTETL